MANYFLWRTVMGCKHRVQISAEQYDDLADAVTTQWEALYIEQKYDFVIENYIEFEETILRCGLEHMILGRGEHKDFNVDSAHFNRRIMNLMTTYKTYDDSLPQHLNRIFHRDEAVSEVAIGRFRQEYEARIGYRAFAKLRNYIQHQGFPLHGSSYMSNWLVQEDDRKHKSRYTIDLYLHPAELRKGDYNRTVLAELEALGEKIDLKILIRDFIEGFSTAHDSNRSILREKLKWASEYIASAEETYLDNGEVKKSLAGFAACKIDSPGAELQKIYLHQTSDEHRGYLEKKNKPLVNLSRRYISNEGGDSFGIDTAF